MALENTDAGIILQAGRNLPDFSPDYAAIAQMQQARQRNQQFQQQQSGNNQLAAMFGDRSNLGPNGLPTTNALTQLSASGHPELMIKMLEVQNELAQQQMAGKINALKFQKGQSDAWLGMAAPLIPQYDQDKEKLGDQKALENLAACSAALLDEARQSGNFTPGFLDQIQRRQVSPEGLRAAVLGSKAIETPKEQRTEKRADEDLLIRQSESGRAQKRVEIEAKKSAPESFTVKVPGSEERIPAVHDPDGGWREDKPDGQ